MDCHLCKKEIKKYEPMLNHLNIDNNTSVDLCQDCIDKIMKWQQEIYAKLFPTSYMKKRFGKK